MHEVINAMARGGGFGRRTRARRDSRFPTAEEILDDFHVPHLAEQNEGNLPVTVQG